MIDMGTSDNDNVYISQADASSMIGICSMTLHHWAEKQRILYFDVQTLRRRQMPFEIDYRISTVGNRSYRSYNLESVKKLERFIKEHMPKMENSSAL
jgi:hypothetical protein